MFILLMERTIMSMSTSGTVGFSATRTEGLPEVSLMCYADRERKTQEALIDAVRNSQAFKTLKGSALAKVALIESKEGQRRVFVGKDKSYAILYLPSESMQAYFDHPENPENLSYLKYVLGNRLFYIQNPLPEKQSTKLQLDYLHIGIGSAIVALSLSSIILGGPLIAVAALVAGLGIIAFTLYQSLEHRTDAIRSNGQKEHVFEARANKYSWSQLSTYGQELLVSRFYSTVRQGQQ